MDKIIEKFQKFISSFIGRIWFDLLMLFSIGLILYIIPYDYFPVEAKLGLINLAVTKFILVSCGICHAHITRKILFPYIHFSKEEEWSNNLMIIGLYLVVIWAWARGG